MAAHSIPTQYIDILKRPDYLRIRAIETSNIRRECSCAHGDAGEIIVCNWLKEQGFDAKRLPTRTGPYDIICNGKRVEVKTAFRTKRDKVWNFHIKAKQNEKCDVFILLARDVPNKGDVFILMRSPVLSPIIRVTERRIEREFANCVSNIAVLR